MEKRTRHATVCLGLLLAACSSQAVNSSVPVGSPAASPTTSVSPGPSTESTPSPSAATSSPTASAEAVAGADFLPSSIVEVVVDGLAVRRGPGIGYQQLDAARFTPNGVEPLESPFRLGPGVELVVQAGPLRVDGVAWYYVRHLGDMMWIDPTTTDSAVDGWVAAGDGGTAYLELSQVPDDFAGFYASGVGSAVTSVVPLLPICSEFICAVWWTAGQADPAGACDLRMTVESTDELLVEQPIRGVTQNFALWVEEKAAIQVDSDCSWSLQVWVAPHP